MIFRNCQSCGGRTRVEAKHLVDDVRCEGCKDPLPPPGEFLSAALRDLQDAGEETKVPILVLFSGERCQASRIVKKHLEKLAERFVTKVLFFEIALERHPDAAPALAIRGTPTLMLGKKGALLHRHEGVVDGPTVERWLREAQRM